ncbi:MAG: hypothetical protein OEL84_01000 [Nitrosopumilus sp.]|nr:hypothetical protein [Nitrosopumilus sp.]
MVFYYIVNTDGFVLNINIHKIRYFESKQLSEGVYLQDVVNDFLSEKGDNIIAVLPVMESTLLVHYVE